MNQRSLIFLSFLAGSFVPFTLYGQATDFQAKIAQKAEARRQAEEARKAEEAIRAQEFLSETSAAASDDPPLVSEEEIVSQPRIWAEAQGRQGRNSEVSAAAGRQEPRASAVDSAAASDDPPLVSEEEIVSQPRIWAEAQGRQGRNSEVSAAAGRQEPRASAVDSAAASDDEIALSWDTIDFQQRLLEQANVRKGRNSEVSPAAGRQDPRAMVVESTSLKEGPPQAEEQKLVAAAPGEMKLGPPPAPPLPASSSASLEAGPMRLGPPETSSSKSNDDSGSEHSVSINAMDPDGIMREIVSLRKEFQEAMRVLREGGGGAMAAAAAGPKKDPKGKPVEAGGAMGDIAASVAEQARARAERAQAAIAQLEEALRVQKKP